MSSDDASFSHLALGELLQRAIADLGYSAMTPIQAQAIPVVLAGRDVMGAAQTGTGKTAAYALPLLERMLAHQNTSVSPARHPVRALALLPTRELADQVAESIRAYAKYTQLRVACVFGGMDLRPQAAQLRAGVEILVATPGRLLDHIEARNCVLNHVEYVVLDEADRMLDIGFLPDLQRILGHLPDERQTLLFSATFSEAIRKLAQSYLHDPLTIEVARPNAPAANVEQHLFEVPEDDKRRALVQLLRARDISQALVFTNSKLGAARLARALERDGLRTAALHGDKTQDERLRALEAFKGGQVQILVATDVAARGLDISDLPAVFNFDLPFHAEDYVHRIGRTGRAGAKGIAISFVEPAGATGRSKALSEIEKLLNKEFTVEHLALAPDRSRRRAAPHARRDDAAGGYPGRDADRGGVPHTAAAPCATATDPFFDRPYEPSGSAEPVWEKRGITPRAPGSALSPSIKPHRGRKVAVLLGGKPGN